MSLPYQHAKADASLRWAARDVGPTMMHACSCLHGQATKLQDMPEADRTGWAADFADILMSDGTQTVLLPQAVHVLK